MEQTSSGIRAHFEALILVVVCTFGCIFFEVANTFSQLFRKEPPFPRVGGNMWEHWDWIAKRFTHRYLEPFSQMYDVIYMGSDNIAQLRALLETRADSIRLSFEARARKWWHVTVPAIGYAESRKKLKFFEGDAYYCLGKNLAAEVVKLQSFLAFRTKLLHEDYVECFGKLTKGRRENSVMSAELMTCSGVVLIKFGNVVKGVVPLEHLERVGCDRIQSTVLDTIRKDSGYEYMCERIKDHRAKFKV